MKYVIYCRKSSDESSDSQKQSIPQQLKACMKYIADNNLEVMEKPSDFSEFESPMELLREDNADNEEDRRIYRETRNLFVIKEDCTGKIPYKRKKRRALIKLIEKKKIKGLLSYSPDRQARNILEGGELINFIDDTEYDLDLKYTNFHFEPTASGKMMLGVWFVFSKQYSDKLSEDVNRGNKDLISNGQSLGEPKYGYFRNEQKYYQPDPNTFDIVRKAFEMKIYGGKTNDYIARWLVSQGVTEKAIDKRHRPNGKNMGAVRKDPFYYGIYTVSGYESDQLAHNPYYAKMISFTEYEQLQKIIDKNNKIPRKGVKSDTEEISIIPNGLLVSSDGYVVNAYLPSKNQRFMPKLKKLRETKPNATLEDVVEPHQVRYKLSNPKSCMDNTEITGDVLHNAIRNKLKQFVVTPEAYKQYADYLKNQLAIIQRVKSEEIRNLTVRINSYRAKFNDFINDNLSIQREEDEQRAYDKKKKDYQSEIATLEDQLADAKRNERNEIVELEFFMGIMNKALEYYDKGSYVQKAKISKILLSNIILDAQKRLTITVNPVFENLFVLCGGTDETRTRDLSSDSAAF